MSTTRPKNSGKVVGENLPGDQLTNPWSASNISILKDNKTNIRIKLGRLLNNPNTEHTRRKILSTLQEVISLGHHTESSINALLDAAIYFDQLGETHYSRHYCALGLEKSLSENDEELQRRAHNIAGVINASVWDFESAFLHFEKALLLSTKQSQFCQFAVIGNVVSTLQIIGLHTYAREITKKLLDLPSNTPRMKALHLQNAINGATLAYLTYDFELLATFNGIAQSIAKQIVTTPLISAFVVVVQAYYSLSQADAKKAYGIVLDAIDRYSPLKNVRLDSVLLAVHAECAFCLKDVKLAHQSIALLEDQLLKLSNYLSDQEDLLRMIVKLHLLISTKETDKHKGAIYVRRLSALVVGKKHKQLFVSLGNRISESLGNGVKLERSTYSLSQIILTVPKLESKAIFDQREIVVDEDIELREKKLAFCDTATSAVESSLRSHAFDIAEEWAIAAECRSGRDGSHCFKVGKVAQLIALRIGMPLRDSVVLDMACRLHNIGYIAFDVTLHKAIKMGEIDPLVLRDHTTVGGSLLSLDADPVIGVAQKVARFHHAWWNGYGHPDSVAGLGIPLEARICAVADNFVDLLAPDESGLPRETRVALSQLQTMSGVQLDPSLVSVALEVVLGNRELATTKKLGDDWLEINGLRAACESILGVMRSLQSV